MSVLHETEQRPLLGRGRQQAEHGESDQEPVRDVTRCEAQGDVQRVSAGAAGARRAWSSTGAQS